MIDFIINTIRLFHLAITFILFGLHYRFVVAVFYSRSVCDRAVRDRKLSLLGEGVTSWLQFSGPAFIKFGQILSTRPDLTGEIISEKLALLQDSLPPFRSKYVVNSIESEFSVKLDEIFESFDHEPIAAASIAQVHKAKLKTGENVAVKVLRPNIAKRFKRDVKLFYFLAKLSKLVFAEANRLHFDEAVKTFEKVVLNELDLTFEAACADKIKKNCAKDRGVRIPKIYWEYTSEKVMVMEWIQGIRVDNKKALEAAGHNLHEVAKKLSITFFNQAYRDGFFHADLHPGNIFVDENGDIALVDFGIIGFLEHRDRVFIAHMLYAFIQKDYDLVARLHFEVGYIPKDMDEAKFALACRSIGEPIIGLPVNKISIAKLLKKLLGISKEFEMELQTQLILLQKTMVTLEGVGYKIYPEVNMWKLSEPWIKKWAKENFGFKAKLKSVKADFKTMATKFPYLFVQIVELVEKGQEFLDLKIDSKKQKEDSKKRLKVKEILLPTTTLILGFCIAALYFAI